MRRQGGTFQNIGPTTVRLTNVTNKISNIAPVQINYDNIISSSQLELLKNLRYTNGQNIINPLMKIGNELLYEVIYRVKNGVPFDSILQFFQMKQWENEDEIYFSFPEFEVARYQYNKFIESYHDEKQIAEGIYTCPKCQSKETISMAKQTRASDEAETVRVMCTNCTHSWRFN